MRRALLVATVGIVVSLILAGVLTGCAAPATESSYSSHDIVPATASNQNMPVSEVKVSRWGFNNTPGEFLLEVEEGQEVEITFIYGDDDLAENNIHIISVPDYGITTDVLDRDNPEITVRFIARETGEVAFMCIAPGCIGHHNLHTIT